MNFINLLFFSGCLFIIFFLHGVIYITASDYKLGYTVLEVA